MDHGDKEVADEEQGNDADDDSFHGDDGLERVTENGVTHTDGEEAAGHNDEDEVGHDGGC